MQSNFPCSWQRSATVTKVYAIFCVYLWSFPKIVTPVATAWLLLPRYEAGVFNIDVDVKVGDNPGELYAAI